MLPWQCRLYFWGVHGIFAEVVFTALWQFIVDGTLTLMGVSSLWSFLTYGLGTFFGAEPVRKLMLTYGVPVWLRCLLYVPLVYAWEFAFGILLSYFHACPWDYSEFQFNVMGLITMEYAPVWLLAGVYFEYLMSVMASLEKKAFWRRKTE